MQSVTKKKESKGLYNTFKCSSSQVTVAKVVVERKTFYQNKKIMRMASHEIQGNISCFNWYH